MRDVTAILIACQRVCVCDSPTDNTGRYLSRQEGDGQSHVCPQRGSSKDTASDCIMKTPPGCVWVGGGGEDCELLMNILAIASENFTPASPQSQLQALSPGGARSLFFLFKFFF